MLINQKVLMSGVDFFDDGLAINPYMNALDTIDLQSAKIEHQSIKSALQTAGVQVIQVEPPAGCQDGVYTANWALCRRNKAVMSSLPNARLAEEPYAETVLRNLGMDIIKVPNGLRFSGQGDALPCGNLLFAGSNYRTDLEVHQFLAENLGFDVISLQTIPDLDNDRQPIINKVSGWPDSFFYDIDLAIAVLSPGLIAWCPEAFIPESQDKLRALNSVQKIEVSLEEAMQGFACNLVSTGETVIMSANAPNFKNDLENLGLKVITPQISELSKGGGYIRCTTLTLS